MEARVGGRVSGHGGVRASGGPAKEARAGRWFWPWRHARVRGWGLVVEACACRVVRPRRSVQGGGSGRRGTPARGLAVEAYARGWFSRRGAHAGGGLSGYGGLRAGVVQTRSRSSVQRGSGRGRCGRLKGLDGRARAGGGLDGEAARQWGFGRWRRARARGGLDGDARATEGVWSVVSLTLERVWSAEPRASMGV
ncbi:uncharacterized protein LOC109810289 [Cajanus cajan]|uniref:uncharacterized protein LOC109810289 n=1 Tax=Cajanus cajan TaxID=3821 RepID=UPI00098D9E86|nr:uncharacterized protein LOC109810289 [Cajanus cajan]